MQLEYTILGLPGLGTAGPVSHPPTAVQNPIPPPAEKRGGVLGKAMVELSCCPAYNQ